jgi:hypothetical protein
MENKRGNPNWKGKSGNPEGRKKGSINVKTEKWHELCDYLLDEGTERLMRALEQLEPKEFVDAYSKILNYIKPKLQSVEGNQTTQMKIVIENELENLKDTDESE